MIIIRRYPLAFVALLVCVFVVGWVLTRTPGTNFSQPPESISIIAGDSLQTPNQIQSGADAGLQQQGFVFTPGTAVQSTFVFPSTAASSTFNSPPALVTTQTSLSPNNVASNALLSQIYSFVPTSYLPASTTAKERTPEQKALYNYGNEAALTILTFENGHADMAQVLSDWIQQRTQPGSNTQALRIADDMQQMGEGLMSLPTVPSEARADNQALAQSVEDAATKFRTVLQDGAGSQTQLENAMKTYNASVDAYTKAFVSLADLFKAQGVTFGAGDPGAEVFALPSGSSL